MLSEHLTHVVQEKTSAVDLELRRRAQELLRVAIVTLLALLEGTEPRSSTAVDIAKVVFSA
jgi:hypothetical protein